MGVLPLQFQTRRIGRVAQPDRVRVVRPDGHRLRPERRVRHPGARHVGRRLGPSVHREGPHRYTGGGRCVPPRRHPPLRRPPTGALLIGRGSGGPTPAPGRPLAMLTSQAIKARAHELGFDLCGIAPAADFDELRFLDTWIAHRYYGTMTWLPRTARVRRDVRQIIPRPGRSSSPARCTTPSAHTRPRTPAARRRTSRATRGVRTITPSSASVSTRCSRGCATRMARRSRRGPTRTRVPSRSVSTRSMPALAGSGSTPV